MKPKQESFLPRLGKKTAEYGGGKEKGKRKIARPFSPKLPMHLVLRAAGAKGPLSLLTTQNKEAVEKLLHHYAKLCHIKIYRFQNVGNHIHLLIQTKAKQHALARSNLSAFLRLFCGQVAMKVSGGKKSHAYGRFWDDLVYSRLVTFGRDFKSVTQYFIKNLFEAHGLWNRKKFPDWQLFCCEASP